MMIEMRDIPGFEGLYAATKDGRIWSYRSARFLRSQAGTNGYRIVNLGASNRNQSVHRLVALAFVPPQEGCPYINHKKEADLEFLRNMLTLINRKGGPLKWLRRWRATTYYSAVCDKGHKAFWAGKERN